MPKPLPPSLSESLPEPQAPGPEAEDVLRTLGNIGLPHEETVGQMDIESDSLEPTLPPWEWSITKAQKQVNDLLTITDSGLTVPELDSRELASIDWRRLQLGYEAYAAIGIPAEIVITPEGRPLDFWHSLFADLRRWQNIHQPNVIHQLKRTSNGDGLFVDRLLDWSNLVHTAHPRWSGSVIPVPPEPPVTRIDYDGYTRADTVAAALTNILDTLQTDRINFRHPSPESYLMLQAIRLHAEQTPIDEGVNQGGVTYATWLAGEFNLGVHRAAPAGAWVASHGIIHLYGLVRSTRKFDLGIRPVVSQQGTAAK